jgi:hypothetical protein
MDLKDAYKNWQENCPDDVMGKPRPKRWALKLKLHKKRKKKTNEKLHN